MEACDDLLENPAGFVDDAEIARVTGFQLAEVRKLLRNMDEDRLVSLVVLADRFKVTIEPGGQLYLYQRFPRETRRKVLSSCVDLSANPLDFFRDVDIASVTKIRLRDVRVCLACLEQDGFVEAIMVPSGPQVYINYRITPSGRQKYRIYLPFPDEMQDKTIVGNSGPSSRRKSGRQAAIAATPIASDATDNPLHQRIILFLAANPLDTVRLRLDAEFKKIEEELARASKRSQFKLVQKWAVSDDDLLRAMLDHEAEIVHFSGHGGGEEGLKFDDGTGKTHFVAAESLARLFARCSDHLRCVVLNACYAETQAEAIVRHIDYVIGMSEDIDDKASIHFSVGFYGALFTGRNYEVAFDFGKIAIELRNFVGFYIPVLKKKQ